MVTEVIQTRLMEAWAEESYFHPEKRVMEAKLPRCVVCSGGGIYSTDPRVKVTFYQTPDGQWGYQVNDNRPEEERKQEEKGQRV